MTLLDSLGIKYDNGSYLTDHGKAKFVLVTGWRKEGIYGEDYKIVENETKVTPKISHVYWEELVGLDKIRDDSDTVIGMLDDMGFVVFSRKKGRYTCYFPDQEVDYNEVRKRFAYPLDVERVTKTLDSFVVPCILGEIKVDPPSGSREDDLELYIKLSRDYFYTIMRRVIELGGYGLKEKLMVGNILRFMIPPDKTEGLKEGLNVDGVLEWSYHGPGRDSFSDRVHNEEWERKEKEIKAIISESYMSLDSISPEVFKRRGNEQKNIFYIPIRRRPGQIVEELREVVVK